MEEHRWYASISEQREARLIRPGRRYYCSETNIMVGTHADSLVAEAIAKGFGDSFDTQLAYEAIHKDATVPPVGDSYIR